MFYIDITPELSSKRLTLPSNLNELLYPYTVVHHFLALAVQYIRPF